jgi:hypothetical protein
MWESLARHCHVVDAESGIGGWIIGIALSEIVKRGIFGALVPSSRDSDIENFGAWWAEREEVGEFPLAAADCSRIMVMAPLVCG